MQTRTVVCVWLAPRSFLRRRGSARLSVWHSKSRWLSIPMQLFVSVLLLALSGAGFVQLTAAKLERLNDRISAYGAGRISLDPADVDLRQFSKEKVLKSLPQQVCQLTALLVITSQTSS